MKGENFIGVVDNVLTPEVCMKCMEAFDRLHTKGMTFSRGESPPISKKDMSTSLAEMLLDGMPDDIYEKVVGAIKGHIINYIEKYEVGMTNRNQYGDYPIIQQNFKVQRTQPSEGYHVWHSENTQSEHYGRFLTWILYLNDVDEGGETELLYLSERIKPKEGRLAIFPAGWTHTHRGNPPLSNTKYIITGWMAHK